MFREMVVSDVAIHKASGIRGSGKGGHAYPTWGITRHHSYAHFERAPWLRWSFKYSLPNSSECRLTSGFASTAESTKVLLSGKECGCEVLVLRHSGFSRATAYWFNSYAVRVRIWG